VCLLFIILLVIQSLAFDQHFRYNWHGAAAAAAAAAVEQTAVIAFDIAAPDQH
jgi:hypothetical protein